MPAHPGGPICFVPVDVHGVILAGVADRFDRYQDRVVVVELAANRPVAEGVDVTLFNASAQPEAGTGLAALITKCGGAI